MKLKHLPWLFVVALAIATGLLYNANQQQAAELAALRSASQELEQLRTSQADTNQSQAQVASDELTRLREENKDVLRLRNEIRQMRAQNQQLSRQAQTAQAQVQSMQAQAEATRNRARNPCRCCALPRTRHAGLPGRRRLHFNHRHHSPHLLRPRPRSAQRPITSAFLFAIAAY